MSEPNNWDAPPDAPDATPYHRIMYELLPQDAVRECAECMTINEGRVGGKHHDSKWKSQSAEYHIEHATAHMQEHCAGVLVDKEDGCRTIIKAAVRLLMAAQRAKETSCTD